MCKVPFLTSTSNRHVLINLGQNLRVIYFICQSTYSGLAIRFAIYNASPKHYSLPRNKTHPVSQLVMQLAVLYGNCSFNTVSATTHRHLIITFFEKCPSSLATTYCIIVFDTYRLSLAARSLTISLTARPPTRAVQLHSKWQQLFVT
jgi:hypothetical protein